MAQLVNTVLSFTEEKEEEFCKLLPANKANHLCQLWQSCSDLHKVQTICAVVGKLPNDWAHMRDW